MGAGGMGGMGASTGGGMGRQGRGGQGSGMGTPKAQKQFTPNQSFTGGMGGGFGGGRVGPQNFRK